MKLLKYLTDPEEPNNPEVKMLNNESGGFEELNTRTDLKFRMPTPLEYFLNVNIELFKSKNTTAKQIRLVAYRSKQLTEQSYLLDILTEEELDDIYNYLDHPVQFSIETHPPKSRSNLVTRLKLNPVVEVLKNNNNGDVYVDKELKLLPSEAKALDLFTAITINIDYNAPVEDGSIIQFLRDGLFGFKTPPEERIKLIEKFTGKLNEENKMELENYIGSSEFIKEMVQKEDEKKYKSIFLNYLIKQGLTEEDAQKELNNIFAEDVSYT